MQHGRQLAVGCINSCVAVAVRGFEPGDEAQFLRGSAGRAPRRRREAGSIGRIVVGEIGLHVLGVRVAVIVDAGVRHQLHALEVIVELEVHHACDRIRAVHRRGAAGQNFDAVDERHRNLIDVGTGAAARGSP